jgi:hypothetical protein
VHRWWRSLTAVSGFTGIGGPGGAALSGSGVQRQSSFAASGKPLVLRWVILDRERGTPATANPALRQEDELRGMRVLVDAATGCPPVAAVFDGFAATLLSREMPALLDAVAAALRPQAHPARAHQNQPAAGPRDQTTGLPAAGSDGQNRAAGCEGVPDAPIATGVTAVRSPTAGAAATSSVRTGVVPAWAPLEVEGAVTTSAESLTGQEQALGAVGSVRSVSRAVLAWGPSAPSSPQARGPLLPPAHDTAAAGAAREVVGMEGRWGSPERPATSLPAAAWGLGPGPTGLTRPGTAAAQFSVNASRSLARQSLRSSGVQAGARWRSPLTAALPIGGREEGPDGAVHRRAQLVAAALSLFELVSSGLSRAPLPEPEEGCLRRRTFLHPEVVDSTLFLVSDLSDEGELGAKLAARLGSGLTFEWVSADRLCGDRLAAARLIGSEDDPVALPGSRRGSASSAALAQRYVLDRKSSLASLANPDHSTPAPHRQQHDDQVKDGRGPPETPSAVLANPAVPPPTPAPTNPAAAEPQRWALPSPLRSAAPPSFPAAPAGSPAPPSRPATQPTPPPPPASVSAAAMAATAVALNAGSGAAGGFARAALSGRALVRRLLRYARTVGCPALPSGGDEGAFLGLLYARVSSLGVHVLVRRPAPRSRTNVVEGEGAAAGLAGGAAGAACLIPAVPLLGLPPAVAAFPSSIERLLAEQPAPTAEPRRPAAERPRISPAWAHASPGTAVTPDARPPIWQTFPRRAGAMGAAALGVDVSALAHSVKSPAPTAAGGVPTLGPGLAGAGVAMNGGGNRASAAAGPRQSVGWSWAEVAGGGAEALAEDWEPALSSGLADLSALLGLPAVRYLERGALSRTLVQVQPGRRVLALYVVQEMAPDLALPAGVHEDRFQFLPLYVMRTFSVLALPEVAPKNWLGQLLSVRPDEPSAADRRQRLIKNRRRPLTPPELPARQSQATPQRGSLRGSGEGRSGAARLTRVAPGLPRRRTHDCMPSGRGGRRSGGPQDGPAAPSLLTAPNLPSTSVPRTVVREISISTDPDGSTPRLPAAAALAARNGAEPRPPLTAASEPDVAVKRLNPAGEDASPTLPSPAAASRWSDGAFGAAAHALAVNRRLAPPPPSPSPHAAAAAAAVVVVGDAGRGVVGDVGPCPPTAASDRSADGADLPTDAAAFAAAAAAASVANAGVLSARLSAEGEWEPEPDGTAEKSGDGNEPLHTTSSKRSTPGSLALALANHHPQPGPQIPLGRGRLYCAHLESRRSNAAPPCNPGLSNTTIISL